MRIGSRGSPLALIQAEIVREALADRGVPATVIVITTAGDRRVPDTPWSEGAFVTAIEAALLAGQVDIAVHSAKDLPTDEDARLEIAAFMPRASPSDVLVVRDGDPRPRSLDDLPSGARVGTDSPRRTAFLRSVRPDLRFHLLHGNVDTRLRRLDAGETDVLVLAEAGLSRLGRGDRIALRLDPDVVAPAPGQGALAVQVRADATESRRLTGQLDDADTRRAVTAERALLAATGGGCRAPIGALGRVDAGRLELLGGYARPDGSVRVTARHVGAAGHGGASGGAASDGGGDERLVQAVLADVAAQAGAAAQALREPGVIVTRAGDQGPALALALVDRGLAPLPVPAIEIQPVDPQVLATALRDLSEFDWVVVTSANAVRALVASARWAGIDLRGRASGPRWAAVGAATRRELATAGIEVAVQPARASGAALADALPIGPGARVLLPRSDIADPVLVEHLVGRGATVDAVVAYRTLEAPAGSVALLEAALARDPVAVIVTSGSTARGLLALAERLDAAERVLALPAIAIGQVTADEATALGYRVAEQASTQRPAGIADAAVRCILGGTTAMAAAGSATAGEYR